MHELLIMAFLFVTAPVSANFIAKVNIHRRSCETPPPPLEDDTWSTLNSPEAEQP
jgi:multicomponent K+:H+ antiporter subunit G